MSPAEPEGTSEPAPSPVVRRKVQIPPVAPSFVRRSRLSDRIATLVDGGSIVAVSASAGSGKTATVVDAMASIGHDVAWLTIDESDAAPGRLVTYLGAALSIRRPEAAEVSRAAMTAALPHSEIAGLLAESVSGSPLVLVVDELENLAGAADAWGLLDAFIRAAPVTLRIVLVSRGPILPNLRSTAPGSAVFMVGEAELAFTSAEAAEALASIGRPEIDARAAVAETGGWVTGVLFEAWNSAAHVAGSGGEVDPLDGYLSQHILSYLDPLDREFLVTTSVLDEVSVSRATTLGVTDAAQRLASLRRSHLPMVWSAAERSMRYHSRFRAFLDRLLLERDPESVAELRRRAAGILSVEGHDEEAAEYLLAAGMLDEARPFAEAAITAVVERMDFTVAERWLTTLYGSAAYDGSTPPSITTARLMLAVSRDDFAEGVRVADGLATESARQALAQHSPHGAALMAWCYLLCARTADADAILTVAPENEPEILAVRYAQRLWRTDHDGLPPVAPVSGGKLDAMVKIARYFMGDLDAAPSEDSAWTEALTTPHRMATLRAVGRIDEALALMAASEHRGGGLPSISYRLVSVELLLDAGRAEEAVAALEEGLRLSHAGGAVAYELAFRILQARADLGGHQTPESAEAMLEALRKHPMLEAFVYYREMVDALLGLHYLRTGRPDRAVVPLRSAVRSMSRGSRLLHLPAAAVYLAEAEWSLGHEDLADRTADLAWDAARRQGTNHPLLQALAHYPAVVSRKIDAEPEGESRWHALGRAMALQGPGGARRTSGSVHAHEFGRRSLSVGGVITTPAISKSHELLCFLVAHDGTASRARVLNELFDGRDDDSARSYVRQAVRKLREVLPTPETLVMDQDQIHLDRSAGVTSDSTRFESMVKEAARLGGGARLDPLTRAVALYERGTYLPGAEQTWIVDRRRRLDELAADARLDLAAGLVEQGDHVAAKRHVGAVLQQDPYREAAWRMAMNIENLVGDYDGVVRQYRRCEAHLAELGLTPTASTRDLMARLRR